MAVLNALKRAAAASSSLFSKLAPSWVLNVNAGPFSYYAHKQMPVVNRNAMFLKGIGVFGRAERPPDLSGMKKNGMMKKLWWLRDEEMKKRSEGSLDSEDDDGRDFREELPWLKDRLDQVVRFRVEENTVFIEGEEKNDERRISGRVRLPRYMEVMNGVQGEINKGVLKLWLPDVDHALYDDDNGFHHVVDVDVLKYFGSSGNNKYDDSSHGHGQGDGAANPRDGDGTAQPRNKNESKGDVDSDVDSDEDSD